MKIPLEQSVDGSVEFFEAIDKEERVRLALAGAAYASGRLRQKYHSSASKYTQRRIGR